MIYSSQHTRNRTVGVWLAILLLFCICNATLESSIPGSSKLVNIHISTRLKEQNLKPSKRSSDAEFLRRVHLDLTGRIPTADEVLEFLNDGSKRKRERKIDRLIGSEAYIQYWTHLWMKWLVKREAAGNLENLEKWVEEALRKNMPYDHFVKALVAAKGDSRDNGAANYILRYELDPVELSAHISRLFLGLPMQCAQCHDHKTEAWFQEDFFGVAAFFTGMKRVPLYETTMDGRREVVGHYIADGTAHPIHIPDTETDVAPRFLDGEAYQGVPTLERKALGEWITHKENPYFAKAIVNRIWSHFMGRAFVEPLDGFGEEYPPSDPDLLDMLAEYFVIYDHDLRYLMRIILNTDAYQRSSETNKNNKDDDTYYSHAYIKPLDPEQFFFSMLQATGFERILFRQDPLDLERKKREYLQRFVFLLDNGENEEIEAFNGTVPQALMMINGAMVNDSADTKARGSFLNYILDKWRDPGDRLERIYLNVLSRPPNSKEKSYFMRYLDRSLYRNKDLAYGDIYWVLLNSAEFALNH
ncbi:MAG: DUF1549 and DUF1553 domain-containing protein [Candidatus Poribacteria bacterium]|nr:DUF1549 and DUF1553 domain-containing protein [Candidatus Poribacteria bacterium]